MSSCLRWFAAFILAVTPIVMSLDFGGVLHWTQYVASLAVLVAIAAAFASTAVRRDKTRLEPFRLDAYLPALSICLFAAFCTLQTIPVPKTMLGLISPASYQAYYDWAAPLSDTIGQQSSPISISPLDSKHHIWLVVLSAAAMAVVPLVFQTRAQMLWLLVAAGIYGCVVSIVGISRQTIPQWSLWSFKEGGEGTPFGTFLNRNNAAFAINLAIGTSLAIILYRWKTRRQVARKRTSHARRLATIAFDPMLVTATLMLVVCIVGLIANGSRGGILAMLAAMVISIAATADRIGRRRLLVASTFLLILVAVSIPLIVYRYPSLLHNGLVQQTITRISDDYRLQHWPDALRASLHFFPFGSGLGSYAFAYLPWQQSSPWRWFTHADNLWLELLVETSVVGLVVAVTIFAMFRNCRCKLGRSKSPIDSGLKFGCMFIGWNIAISQCFDFGLMIPSNLLFAAILFAAFWSWATQLTFAANPAATQEAETPRSTVGRSLARLVPAVLRPITLANRCRRRLGHIQRTTPLFVRHVIPATLSMTIAGIAVGHLRFDGRAEYATGLIRNRLCDQQTGLADLLSLEQRYAPLKSQHPTADLIDAFVDLNYEIARLQELQTHSDSRLPKLHRDALYAQTSKLVRRLAWRRNSSDAVVTRGGLFVEPLQVGHSDCCSVSSYTKSLRLTDESLAVRPLSIKSRFNLVALEFAHQDSDRTVLALRQSAQLFHRSPDVQLRVGTSFADHADFDRATAAFRRAAALSPEKIALVFGKAKRYAGIHLDQIIPEDSRAKLAAETYLNQHDLN
ncbi:O-antigen ligase family protein [Stieleria sp. JC731]|uniref:O-antigen ligase family protein n=1 Tax=Pirellulaceae TaxID=2691357 RepID=UPI001E338A4C|nr:O-antigen ligase family protein [Stieleria sp. JC731]MCC9601243.1 O-antigen ligase family protein [Stieleria sp. JC731]